MIRLRTASNVWIDLERPTPTDFQISDIATGLSNTCRFAGQIQPFYSVAQHCVLVSQLVPKAITARGLMHDASEAYLGDMSRHLKHSDYLSGYRAVEAHVTRFIDFRFFGREMNDIEKHVVKVADDLAACFEQVVLRESQPWIASIWIPKLVEQGFIKCDQARAARLLGMASMRLPDRISYDALPATVARTRFLEVFTKSWSPWQ